MKDREDKQEFLISTDDGHSLRLVIHANNSGLSLYKATDTSAVAHDPVSRALVREKSDANCEQSIPLIVPKSITPDGVRELADKGLLCASLTGSGSALLCLRLSGGGQAPSREMAPVGRFAPSFHASHAGQGNVNADMPNPTTEAPEVPTASDNEPRKEKSNPISLYQAFFSDLSRLQKNRATSSTQVSGRYSLDCCISVISVLYESDKPELMYNIYRTVHELDGQYIAELIEHLSSFLVEKLEGKDAQVMLKYAYYSYAIIVRALHRTKDLNENTVHNLLDGMNHILKPEYKFFSNHPSEAMLVSLTFTLILDWIVDSTDATAHRDLLSEIEKNAKDSKNHSNISTKLILQYIAYSINIIKNCSPGVDELFLEHRSALSLNTTSESKYEWGYMALVPNKQILADRILSTFDSSTPLYKRIRIFDCLLNSNKSSTLASSFRDNVNEDKDFNCWALFSLVRYAFYEIDPNIRSFIFSFFDKVESHLGIDTTKRWGECHLKECLLTIYSWLACFNINDGVIKGSYNKFSLNSRQPIGILPEMLIIHSNQKLEIDISATFEGDNEKTLLSTFYNSFRFQPENEVLKGYVPLLGSIDGVSNHFGVFDRVNNFLRTPSQKVCLIMGGSGAGKTTFGRFLVNELWSALDKEPDTWVPVFIPLLQVADVQKLEQYLQPPRYIFDVPKALQGKKVVYVLDGFDEIERPEYILSQELLNRPKTKIIITNRTQGLENEETIRKYFVPKSGGKDLPGQLIRFYIMPFNSNQIKTFFEEYLKTHNRVDLNAEACEREIRSVVGLEDLIKIPYFLYMMAELIDDLHKVRQKMNAEMKSPIPAGTYNRLLIYQMFVDKWVGRQYSKVNQKLTNSKESIIDFHIRLALEMSKRDLTSVRYPQPDSIEWDRFFANTGQLPLIRSCCTIRKTLINTTYEYTFIHKSLQDYFTAAGCMKEIEKWNSDESITFQSFSNTKKLAPDILLFMSNRASLDHDFANILTKIIQRSRSDPRYEYTSTNAATILNYARFSFANMDLSRAFLKDADLSCGILHLTNMEEANLEGALLADACLDRCNLREANLVNVEFNQGAPIKVQSKANIRHCCVSPSNQRLYIAVEDVIQVHDPRSQGAIETIPASWFTVCFVAHVKSSDHKSSTLNKADYIFFGGTNGASSLYECQSKRVVICQGGGSQITDMISIFEELAKPWKYAIILDLAGVLRIIAYNTKEMTSLCIADMNIGQQYKSISTWEDPTKPGKISIAAGSRGGVHILDVEAPRQGQVVIHPTVVQSSVKSFSFSQPCEWVNFYQRSPNPTELYCMGSKGTLGTINLTTGEYCLITNLGLDITQCRLIKNATGIGYLALTSSNDICLYDFDLNEVKRQYCGHLSPPISYTSHSAENAVTLISADKKMVRFWDLSAKSRMVHSKGHTQSVNAVGIATFTIDHNLPESFGNDRGQRSYSDIMRREFKYVVTAGSDDVCMVWDYNTCNYYSTVLRTESRIRRMAIAGTHPVVCTNERGAPIFTDIFLQSPPAENRMLRRIEGKKCDKTSNLAEISVKDQIFASVHESGHVVVWKFGNEDFQEISSAYKPGFKLKVVTCAGPNNEWIIAFTAEGHMIAFEWNKGGSLDESDIIVFEEDICGGLDTIIPVPQGKTADVAYLIGLDSGELCLISVLLSPPEDEANAVVKVYRNDENPIGVSVALIPKDKQIYVCLGDEKGEITMGILELPDSSWTEEDEQNWWAPYGRTQRLHNQELIYLRYVPEDNVLLTGSRDRTFKKWGFVVSNTDEDAPESHFRLLWTSTPNLTAFGCMVTQNKISPENYRLLDAISK